MRRVLVALTVLALMAPALPAMTARADSCDSRVADLCQKIEQGRQQQSQSQATLDTIQAQIADANAKDLQLSQLVAQIGSQIDAQKKAIQDTTERIAEVERKIRLVQADITRRQAHLDVRGRLLDQRVRSLAAHSTTDYLAVLVTARSFTEMIDRVVLLQDVIRGDQRMVDDLRRQRDAVTALERDQEQARSRLAGLLGAQRQQEAALQSEMAVQQQALAAQRQLEAQLSQQRQEMEAQIAQLEGSLASWQQQYQDQIWQLDHPPTSGGGGTAPVAGFIWPVGGRLITQYFGCTSLVGEPWMDPPGCYFHTGIDIGMPSGAPIMASRPGVVVYTGWRGGYGNSTIVQHGGGFTTTYNHQSAIVVSPGESVQQGEVIGYVGSTGFSTGPHLHFEILSGGGFQNPCEYLGC
jgi:murein DD-endopeptidase MepM/ murein hydrolase activator NlpD